MIVKIKSFKQAAYRTLLNYILHDEDRLFDKNNRSFLFTQNLKGNDMQSWITELRQNEKQRVNKRKNQIYFTHEILSWHRDDTPKLTVAKMHAITKEYVRLRAGSRGVVVASPHYDQQHYHVHLLVGAIDRSGQTMRMTREELAEVKINLQEYCRMKYPELEKSVVKHGRKHLLRGITREQQPYSGSKKSTLRDHVLQIVSACLDRTHTVSAFLKKLEAAECSTYLRGGRVAGIVYQGRKYRLRTLGIDSRTLQNGQRVIQRQTYERTHSRSR
jgi:hypothetical protein